LTPPVSVYVPAYNAEEFLARCIESLLTQTHRPAEILIVDDGSRDSTREIATRYPQVTLLSHTQNRGLGAARNTAFQAARYELVASLDADCVAEPTWLEQLVKSMEERPITGVGGRLVEGVRESLADRWRCAHMLQEWGDAPLDDPLFLFGCNNLFRKTAVLEAGGYNEDMRTNGEDADLTRRLKARGHWLVYNPSAVATHQRHDSVLSIMNTYWRWTFHGFEGPHERLKLHKILRRAVLGNVWYMFGGLAKEDLRVGRLELLTIDAGLLLYFPYRELKEWKRLRTSSSER